MNYPNLVSLGKLGGRDTNGFHHVMIKPDYRNMFSGLEELYLIFNSDRVFYVTISERKQSDKKLWVKFREDGIAEEQPKHKDVILAIAEAAAETEVSGLDALTGYRVISSDEVLGVVEGSFFNGAQHVLQIVDKDGCELLVPFVDHYIEAVMDKLKRIILHNAEGLIDFYRQVASPGKS